MLQHTSAPATTNSLIGWGVGSRAAQGQSGEYKILPLQPITPRVSGNTVLPVAMLP